MRFVGLLGLVACGGDPLVEATAVRRPDLDAVFRSEARWLGGDGAYAIDLGADRTLWLFGDSFIATSPALVRSESRMVRNSVAVMTGRDLATATMQHAWREDGGVPGSFFPESGDRWYWPSHGVRAPDGELVVFLSEIRPTPGEGLGFADAGFHAVRIADTSLAPSAWQLERLPYAELRGNVACTAVDGDSLVAVIAGGAAHDGRLVRWPLDALATAPPVELGVTIDDGATECSLHHDAASGRWIYLYSRGFGATTIAIRTAPELAGPWSDPLDVLTPPESRVDGAFVYAAKAHPSLHEGDAIVVTFVDNSFELADLFDPSRAQTLYWPHIATLELHAR